LSCRRATRAHPPFPQRLPVMSSIFRYTRSSAPSNSSARYPVIHPSPPCSLSTALVELVIGSPLTLASVRTRRSCLHFLHRLSAASAFPLVSSTFLVEPPHVRGAGSLARPISLFLPLLSSRMGLIDYFSGLTSPPGVFSFLLSLFFFDDLLSGICLIPSKTDREVVDSVIIASQRVPGPPCDGFLPPLLFSGTNLL